MIRTSVVALGATALLATVCVAGFPMSASAFMAGGGPGGGGFPGGGFGGGHGPAFGGGRGPGMGLAPMRPSPRFGAVPGLGRQGAFGPPRPGYGANGHYYPPPGYLPPFARVPGYGPGWRRGWNPWRGWYPWAGAYSAWPGGFYGGASSIVADQPVWSDRPSLPTAWDLPVVGYVNQGVEPPVLYEIDDLSKGRSGQRGGAKIVSVGKPEPLPGVVAKTYVPGMGGPKIIHLTAK